MNNNHLGRCLKCNKDMDRKGMLCKVCYFESIVYSSIKQREENKALFKEFEKELPSLREKILKKVMDDLDKEEKKEHPAA